MRRTALGAGLGAFFAMSSWKLTLFANNPYVEGP